MSNALQFVESLDGLIRLCASGPEEYSEQQVLLRAAERAIGAGEVALMTGPGWPTLNGVDMDGVAAEPDGLVARLWSRRVQRLFVARDADPAELLLLARVLAGAPTGEEDGAELLLRTVRLSPLPGDDAGLPRCSPSASWTAPELVDQNPFEPTPREPRQTGVGSHLVLDTVVGDGGSAAVAVEHRRVAPMINTPVLLRTIVEHDKCSLSLDALLDMLTSVGTLPDWQRLPELSLILEEVGRRAEESLRRCDSLALRTILVAVLRRAEDETQHEARLTFRLARRRLLTLPYLRAIAPLLPRSPECRDDLLYVLGQAGDEGADAVIEQLIAAESSSDRRVYTTALMRLSAGERTLLHMLSDERWYVVRNAADLLGEMQAEGAEEPLLRALNHADERVRRSALGALARLGTSRALHGIQDALVSGVPGVRAHAATVLAASTWPYTVATVRRQLREEEDRDVQLALVAALGRVASADAVELLHEIALPPRLSRLIGRSSPLRAAALQSLVDAHTPAARVVVERLSRDRTAELRVAARRAIDHWESSGDD